MVQGKPWLWISWSCNEREWYWSMICHGLWTEYLYVTDCLGTVGAHIFVGLKFCCF